MGSLVPIGMSFWTLEMVEYISEVKNRKVTVHRNPLKLACCFTYFPKVVQGPIERIGQSSIERIGQVDYNTIGFEEALREILAGFFLKLVIADRAKIYVDSVYENWQLISTRSLWVGAILYSFQLYADFLGCMKIVTGSSRLLGVELSSNFKRPYLAVSVKDFWRRWHISFSSWLRDYIYIPLGGNRKGKIRKYVNVLVVFFVSGLWHGGGLTFIIWGLLHGLYQVAEKLFGRLFIFRKKIPKAICIPITFVFITLAWVFFRSESVHQGISIIGRLFLIDNMLFPTVSFLDLGLSSKQWLLLISMILIWVIYEIFLESIGEIQDKDSDSTSHIIKMMKKTPRICRYSFYIIFAVFITVFGVYGYGYNEQDFIYRGF